MVLVRAQRVLAGSARGLVLGSARAGGSLARQVPQNPARQPAVPAAPAARLFKPQLAMNSQAQREHATTAQAKVGAVRTDWT